jgi:RNA polymerase sigma factor (sigma-70 family)
LLGQTAIGDTKIGRDVVSTNGSMDRSAFTELYRRFAPLVHARAKRMVGSHADDVVQEVFLRLARSPPNDRALATWIYTTSTSVCLDLLRHAARRDAAWQQGVRDGASGTAVAIDEGVFSKDLCRKILSKFDRRTQAVVALIFLDEMTQEEAAEALGISLKTVGERLARFQTNVRKMLQRWEP